MSGAPLPSSVISDPEDTRPELIRLLETLLADSESVAADVDHGDAQPALPAANAAAPASSSMDSRQTRREVLRQRLEAAKQKELALEAAQRAVRERREAAKRASEAARQASREARQGAGVVVFDQISTDPIFLMACQNILPLCMASAHTLNEEYAKPKAVIDLSTLFTKSLTTVCELVYGRGLTADLAIEFSGKHEAPYIRHFFERTKAGGQCRAVIDAPKADTVCWICNVKVAGMGTPECEHKLSILPALLLTGLFDAKFYAWLQKNGREQEYLNLLEKTEYAWAHQRCNQIKSDDVFIDYDMNRGLVVFQPSRSAIVTTLDVVIQTPYANYSPKLETLRSAIDATRTDFSRWPNERAPGVASQLSPLFDKVNAKGFTAKQLMSHFINGLLDRAIVLAPGLVAKHIEGLNLTERQRTLLNDRLAGKTGGKLRRRTTRRKLRGGADDIDLLLADIALTITKAMGLRDLQRSVEGVFPAEFSTPRETPLSQLPAIFDDYQIETDTLAIQALAYALTTKPTTVPDLCKEIYNAVVNQKPRWRLRNIEELSAANAGPEIVESKDGEKDRPKPLAAAAAASSSKPTEDEDGEEDSPVAAVAAVAPMLVDTSSSGNAGTPPQGPSPDRRPPPSGASTLAQSLVSPGSIRSDGLSLMQGVDSPMPERKLGEGQQRLTAPSSPSSSESEREPIRRRTNEGAIPAERPSPLPPVKEEDEDEAMANQRKRERETKGGSLSLPSRPDWL